MSLLLGATTNYPQSNDEDVEAEAGPYGMWRVFANGGTFDPTPVLAAIKIAATIGRKHLMVSTRVRDWAGITAGQHDTEIFTLARTVEAAAVASGVTVWLTNWHEPEDDLATYSTPVEGREAWKAQIDRFCAIVNGAAPILRTGAILMGWHSLSKSSPWYSTWEISAAIPEGIDWLGFNPYQNYGLPKAGGGVRNDWVDLPSYAAFLAQHAGSQGIDWGFAEWGGTEAALTKQPTWMADVALSLAALGGSFGLYFDNTTYLQKTSAPVPATTTTFAMPTGSKRRAEWTRLLKVSRG